MYYIYYILCPTFLFLQEVEQEVTRPLLKVWPLPEKATQFPFPHEESPNHKMWEPRNNSQVGHIVQLEPCVPIFRHFLTPLPHPTP